MSTFDYTSLDDMKDLGKKVGLDYDSNLSEKDFRIRLANCIIHYDPRMAARVVHGANKDWFLPIETLENIFKNNKLKILIKKNELMAKGDTYDGMPWSDLLNILADNDFVKVHSQKSDDGEITFWANYDKGYLLSGENQNNKLRDLRITFEEHLEIPGEYFAGGFLDEARLPEPLKQKRVAYNNISNMFLTAGYTGLTMRIHNTYVENNLLKNGLVGFLKTMAEEEIQTNNPWKFYEYHSLEKRMDLNEETIHQLPERVKTMIGYKKVQD